MPERAIALKALDHLPATMLVAQVGHGGILDTENLQESPRRPAETHVTVFIHVFDKEIDEDRV